jgi:hypothetical protein
MIGAIKLFSKQNCDGCVMADDGGIAPALNEAISQKSVIASRSKRE